MDSIHTENELENIALNTEWLEGLPVSPRKTLIRIPTQEKRSSISLGACWWCGSVTSSLSYETPAASSR